MTSSTPSIADVLKKTALFSALSDAELQSLATCTLIRSYASAESLFSEGTSCEGLYIVSKGRVRIFKTSPAGREQVLAIEGPGSSIAELPVFDGGPYPASVTAVEPSELLFIARKDFRALCVEYPEIALKVLEVAGARLRRLVGIIEELSFTTVRHRLAALLVRLARTEGAEFTLPANNQELAAQIGTVRELVSRNLSRLQAEGLIAIDGRSIRILDLKGLQAELESA